MVDLSEFHSVMETADDAVKLIGKNDLVIMPSNGAVLYKGKKFFNKNIAKTGGEGYLLSAGIVCGLLEIECEIDGYLPCETLCADILKRYLYIEPRGFLVISEKEFTLRNSPLIQIVDDPIDTLYRFMQFDRPRGGEIVSEISLERPRVLGSRNDFERIVKNVKSDKLCAHFASEVIKRADALLTKPLCIYEVKNDGDSPNMLKDARDTLSRMEELAVAFILTGDDKYADCAWRIMERAAACEHWCDKTHFLSTAELSYAMAIGFDTFYDKLTENQRSAIKAAIINKAFVPGLQAYAGNHPNGYWVNGDDNWTAVCPGGLMAAAVALCGEEDTDEICSIILENTLQSFEYIFGLLFPDGAWYESVTYLAYSVIYMAAGLGSLFHANGGRHYGLFDAPGAEKMGGFLIGMHGAAEGAFNYHDGNDGFVLLPEFLWYANELGDRSFFGAAMKLRELLGETGYCRRYLLYYRPEYGEGNINFPKDMYFRGADVGSMRSDWTRDSLWAAVHAGQNGVDHDNLDLGEFIFEADGIRWVYDHGADDYALPDYFGPGGYDIYRKRPEANNCYIINPRAGYHGQSMKCTAGLIESRFNKDEAMMKFDLSQAYSEDAKSAVRTFILGDKRQSFTVIDSIEMDGENEVYWFMNLKGNITVTDSGAAAELDGKKLMISISADADSYDISAVPCVPLATSPTVKGMADDSDKQKLLIRLNNKGSLNIKVRLAPIRK